MGTLSTLKYCFIWIYDVLKNTHVIYKSWLNDIGLSLTCPKLNYSAELFTHVFVCNLCVSAFVLQGFSRL